VSLRYISSTDYCISASHRRRAISSGSFHCRCFDSMMENIAGSEKLGYGLSIDGIITENICRETSLSSYMTNHYRMVARLPLESLDRHLIEWLSSRIALKKGHNYI
jgi:hypothetical protein